MNAITMRIIDFRAFLMGCIPAELSLKFQIITKEFIGLKITM
jgi:hypothetical protein